MFQVDTNVISAAPRTRAPPAALANWMDTHAAELFLSVVTVAEIEAGIRQSFPP